MFNIDSLSELVDDTYGKIIPYDSNPWELGYPDNLTLQAANVSILESYEIYAKNAYKKAVNNYITEEMFNEYFKQF